MKQTPRKSRRNLDSDTLSPNEPPAETYRIAWTRSIDSHNPLTKYGTVRLLHEPDPEPHTKQNTVQGRKCSLKWPHRSSAFQQLCNSAKEAQQLKPWRRLDGLSFPFLIVTLLHPTLLESPCGDTAPQPHRNCGYPFFQKACRTYAPTRFYWAMQWRGWGPGGRGW